MSNPYKPDRLENKRILVSGAGSGIGHAIANRFRDEGAHVIAIDTPDTDLSGLQGIETHSVDLSQAKTLKQLAETVPELHSIYINTSHTAVGTLLACNSAEWHQSFEEIVHTAFRITQAFIPTLIYSGGGSVTLMSSISGSMVGLENRCAYSAAKSALIGLTKSIAIDYASHGIRCNAICTGIFATDDIHAQLGYFRPNRRKGAVVTGS